MRSTFPFHSPTLWMIFALAACVGGGSELTAQNEIDFNSQVKPILSDNCFACHGPDASERPSDLRLDDQASVLSDLGGYAAIVPNDSDASELIQRILSDDQDSVMPPHDYRKKLSAEQKQILVDWVNQGAPWEEHWAFVPPKRVSVPEASGSQWPVNDIDRFVLSRLNEEKLTASKPAGPATLLRRLSFDLTGLPPKYERVKAFVDGDESYEAAVDRLLASPHFGERLAVYWLDSVRYADSVGYHGDQEVSITPYRDYVVDAFNQNMPFDQFTVEQLAGDLLKDPTPEQLIASGYNRLGMMSAEGGVQPEEYLAKYAADRVRTTASVWLGVTLGCAECHDHKFDPFTTKEFYEFGAFFADIKERGLYAGANRDGRWGPMIDVPNDGLAELLAPFDMKIKKLENEIAELASVKSKREEWERTLNQKRFDWTTLHPDFVAAGDQVKTTTAKDGSVKDGSVLVGGHSPNETTYVITADLPVNQKGIADVKAIRLEVLPHKSLPGKGPGRAGNGNFVVTQIHVLSGDQRSQLKSLGLPVKQWPQGLLEQEIELTNPTATVEQTQGGESHPDKKWSAKSVLDRNVNSSKWGWAILPDAGKQNELVVQIAADQELQNRITIVIQQKHGNGKHTLGHFRISWTADEMATSDPQRGYPDIVKQAIAVTKKERTAKQVQGLHDFYTASAPQFAELNSKLAAAKAAREKIRLENTRTTLVTVATAPREMRVLGRGDWMDKTGEVVSPGVPASLGEKTWTKRATRKDLAEWIVDKKNPLTARVFVNRLWRMFFGTGLSNVLDDLGSQGEPPSHAALLDHLAVEFVNSGWDVKHVVRLMVTSQTYRQTSSYRADLKEVDPENRLLARQSRFRLDAEFVRDNVLSVSGLLIDEIGGKSGKPYQPEGLYRHLNFPKRKYQPAIGKQQYRRGLYTHWQRQFLHPAMKTFDAPAREECTAARPRSSTPLAALVMLNDPSYVEAARVLADRILSDRSLEIENTQDESQVLRSRFNLIFETALARNIDDEEFKVLSRLLDEHTRFYAVNPEAAKSLILVGQSTFSSDHPVEERAAWTSVCRAVMNLHEFVLRK